MTLLRRTDVLVLETIGARTGKRRRTPVAYWLDGDDNYLIGGGAAGMTKVDWVANLRANPEGAVWVRRRRVAVTAEEFGGAEYERIKQEAFERWPGARKYEQVSGRSIPYFRLRVAAP
jgi:deazaflavin-dependent oxidoreductase (nitroreductase family)